MTEIRLGLVLLRRGGLAAVGRLLGVAAGAALATVVIAGLTSLPAIFDGLSARTKAATAIEDPSSTLLGRSLDGTLEGEFVTRVVLAGTGAPPPGIAAIPADGQAFVSPALAKLINDDPLVATRFPQHIVGTIAPAGLIDPSQLLAYIGVPSSALSDPATPISFGSRSADPGGSKQVLAVIVAGCMFVLLPVLGFSATSARLSARVRDQRLAALRLVGMSRQRVRLVNAVEPGLGALLGGVVGVGLWAHFQPPLGRRGIGGFGWFASDAPMSPLRAFAIMVASSVVAVAVATFSANRAIDEPLTERRSASGDTKIVWRAAVLGAGVCALVVAAWRAGRGVDRGTYWLLLLGSLAAVVGVSLAHPLLSRLLAKLIDGRESTVRLLASRRLRYQHAATSRILTGVLLATFAIGLSQGLIAVIGAADWQSDDAEPIRLVSTTVERAVLADLPGVDGLVANVMLPSRDFAMAATCDDLRALTGGTLAGCPETRPIELVAAGATPQHPEIPTVEVDWPSEISSYMRSNVRGLVVAPRTEGASPTASWWIRVEPGEASQFEAALQGLDPTTGAGDYTDDRRLAQLLLAVVTVGVAASFGLGLASVVMSGADIAIERRRLDANVIALGVPATVLRRTQFVVTTLPVALSVTAAAIVGSLAGYTYRRAGAIDGHAPFPWGTTFAAASVGVLGALLAGAVSYALTPTGLRDEHTRSE